MTPSGRRPVTAPDRGSQPGGPPRATWAVRQVRPRVANTMRSSDAANVSKDQATTALAETAAEDELVAPCDVSERSLEIAPVDAFGDPQLLLHL